MKSILLEWKRRRDSEQRQREGREGRRDEKRRSWQIDREGDRQ